MTVSSKGRRPLSVDILQNVSSVSKSEDIGRECDDNINLFISTLRAFYAEAMKKKLVDVIKYITLVVRLTLAFWLATVPSCWR
jgi:hypothetical protein